MKILHVISQRPEFTGSGIYIRAMMREAANNGHQNFLLAGVPASQYPEWEDIPIKEYRYVEFEGRDLMFPVVGMSDTMPYTSRRFRDLTPVELEQYESAFSEKLKLCVQDYDPDLIHCHHLWLVSAYTRELFPQTPIIASCHGTGIRQLSHCPQHERRVTTSCGKIDRIFALGQQQAKEIHRIYKVPSDNIRIVGGGYNKALFFSKKRPPTDEIQLLFAGKLSRSKGFFWLLKALAQVTTVKWRLHVAGSGSQACSEACQNLLPDLTGKVEFHGMLNQRDLADLMRQSHIFILPSFYEGLPLVTLEALACGCRVVVSSLPGTREIFKSGESDYTSLIPLPPLETIDHPFVKDIPKLESALAEVITKNVKAAEIEPNIDLSRVSEILATYTWESVFERVQSVYHELGG